MTDEHDIHAEIAKVISFHLNSIIKNAMDIKQPENGTPNEILVVCALKKIIDEKFKLLKDKYPGFTIPDSHQLS